MSCTKLCVPVDHCGHSIKFSGGSTLEKLTVSKGHQIWRYRKHLQTQLQLSSLRHAGDGRDGLMDRVAEKCLVRR